MNEINKEFHFSIKEPLNSSDTELQTFGCRANNPLICKNCFTENICAFVSKDHICHAPSIRWKKYYYELLDKGDGKVVRKNNEKKGKEIKKILKFSDYNIPIGSKLVFKDNEKIVVEVIDESHVSYKGKKYSLSRLACELRNCYSSLRGPFYFKYNGKQLTKIREELNR